MTIFIANANGKIGQEVVKGLLQHGQSVRVGVRDAAKARAEFPGAEVVAIDLAEPASFAAGLKGARAVFSAIPSQFGTAPELALVAAAKPAGVERFVKLSAMGVDQAPFGADHMATEKAVKESGLDWTILRPNFFMQNYSTAMAGSIKAERKFYEAASDARTSLIDARDIAAVAVQALTAQGHAGKTYDLTGPAAIDRHEVAKAIGDAIGTPVTYVAIDNDALMQALAGAPEKIRTLYAGLYTAVRAGYTAGLDPTVTKLLGRPAISFAQFAKDHADVWR